MRPLPKLLSKSKIMRGYRCLKAIYLTIQRPDLEPPVTPEMQALFDQGNRIGELARTYYPGGELVDFPPWEFVNSLKRTRELIALGREFIYEAAFEYKGCYARADIIRYSPASQRWTILEAKSSTKVKEEHIDDVGLQAWIIANSGLPIEKICILHLNPECRFPDLKNLFIEKDVTDLLRENYRATAPRLSSIFETLRRPQPPEVDIGPQCGRSRDCEFKTHCFTEKNLPDISVLDVYLLENKWELYAQGKVRLEDLPLDGMNEIQQRMVHSHLTGKRFVDFEGLKEGLADWKFPLVFLDFETIGHAVPRFEACSPYQQVPFQFSVHLLESLESTPRQVGFLHDGAGDPRRELIPALLQACSGPGSIVAYNKRFEIRVIEQLADAFPEYSEPLRELCARFQDPLPLIRKTVYDPGFRGGFGLKKVAPSLLGERYSYGDLLVGDGTAAQRAYEDLNSGRLSATEKARMRQALLEYCAQDTLAALELVRWCFAPSAQRDTGA